MQHAISPGWVSRAVFETSEAGTGLGLELAARDRLAVRGRDLCPPPTYLSPAGIKVEEDILSSVPAINAMDIGPLETAGLESGKKPQPPSSLRALRHQCRFCSYASPHRGSLVLHERVHTGERPFRCHLCSRGFAHRSHVVRHLRTHTGERPFRCPLCPAAFSQRSNVKVHLRSHAARRQGNAAAIAAAHATAEDGGNAVLQM